MYKYLSEVQNLVNEILDGYEKKRTKEFYQSNINQFFNEYMSLNTNVNKPLNVITYYDIDTYINGLKYSDADKLNHYNALKRFFNHTYNKGITSDVMSQVIRPEYIKAPMKIIEEKHYYLMNDFIFDRNNDIKERLALGLFLFTGLSRKYIHQLRNKQFIFNRGIYYLHLWKDEEEIKLPLKAEMQILVNEYLLSLPSEGINNKVIERDENYLSTYISNLCLKACGKKYTPTILSSTFITKALLNGNYIWEVSKLTLESVTVIEDYIKDTEYLLHRQTSILNSF
jgi:hypothetical protein